MGHGRTGRRLRGACLLGACAGLLVLGGCASAPGRRPPDPARDIVDADPGLRSRTLALAAGRSDRQRLAEWIERLDDPDATVRLQASAALKQATGQPSAYRPFDPIDVRRSHLEAWRAWWRREIARPDPVLLASPAASSAVPGRAAAAPAGDTDALGTDVGDADVGDAGAGDAGVGDHDAGEDAAAEPQAAPEGLDEPSDGSGEDA